MVSQRKFYRSVFQVEVLSEQPYGQEGKDLAEIAYDITEGPFNGNVATLAENEEIDGRQAARFLIDSGSDPGFFGLTEDGEDEAV